MKNKLKIGNIIKGMIEKDPKYNSIKYIYSLRSFWPKIVGITNSRNSIPVSIKYNVLLVYTRTQTWSFQLQFLKEEIKDKILELTGKNLKDIRFKVDKLIKKSKLKIKKYNKVDFITGKKLTKEEKIFLEKISLNLPEEQRFNFIEMGKIFILKNKYIKEKEK